jgi:hypothetical protein
VGSVGEVELNQSIKLLFGLHCEAGGMGFGIVVVQQLFLTIMPTILVGFV